MSYELTWSAKGLGLLLCVQVDPLQWVGRSPSKEGAQSNHVLLISVGHGGFLSTDGVRLGGILL